MRDPSTVLLIGAGGLVGRHLRDAFTDTRVVPTFHHAPTGDGLVLDLADHDAIRRTIREVRPNVILLAAADAFVERCEREPVATRRINVDAPQVIASESDAIDAALLVFSSDYVFDGTAGSYNEGDERRPINEYGRQKVDLEDLTLATRRGIVCRTSGVFGLEPQRKNFVCQLVDRLRVGKTFDVPSDQLITPTYARSLAEAVARLVGLGHRGVFHTAGPRILGRMEFARLVVNAYGLPPRLLHARTTDELGLAARRPLHSGLAVRKLREAIGSDLTGAEAALREMAHADSA